MRHYVAYNKIEDWGQVREGGSMFEHWSSKSKDYLEKTIGQTVWVLSGERVRHAMIYRLCHVYEPAQIRRDGKGYRVAGRGTGFVPHVNVTYCRWLPKLLREQNNFRFGLNEVRSRTVIHALLRLREDPPTTDFPDEITESQRYPEGAKRRVVVNAFERNERARAACLAYYGTNCVVCGFNFEVQYGERGAGAIHVHHVKPLFEIGKAYRVDPIKDLRPVCPNCHTIIHRGKDALSIAQAKALVRVRLG
jgi:hypothetical protein